MDSSHVVWVLGAYDPEMRAIRHMLRKAGHFVAAAHCEGRPCTAHNAYRADALSRRVPEGSRIVWVECRTDWYSAGHDLIVDHHHPGDPGFDASPNEFWEGSAIGQVARLIGVSEPEHRLVAASDHCLSAAMRGECPGIDPAELMNWRIVARSSMARIPRWQLKLLITRAVDRLQSLPRLSICGVEVVDASFDTTPELRDAAALSCLPILTTRTNADGRIKVGLYGAKREVTATWMKAMDASGLVDHCYGNPNREYAGAVLTRDASALVAPGGENAFGI